MKYYIMDKINLLFLYLIKLVILFNKLFILILINLNIV